MTDYLDVGQFHKNESSGKWRFQRLGYAKKNDKGGLDVYLDALPIPGPYGVRLSINKREERPQQNQGYNRAPASSGGMDDEIPF